MTEHLRSVWVCLPAVLLLLAGRVPEAGARSGNQAGSGIIAPGSRVEKLFGEAQFTEGPAAGPDGAIYFSDLTWESTDREEDGHLWRYDPASGACRVYRSPSGMSNGIAFDAQGRMVACTGSDLGGRALIRTSLESGKSEILASSYNGRPLNSPNDLVIDSKGRVYFTDPRYGDVASVRQPAMGVYRLDTDGRLTLIIGDIPMPNGIALSPDERTLYVGCNDEGGEVRHAAPRPPLMQVLAYRLSPDGVPGDRRMLISYPPDAGPDGFAVDREGHLYVAVRDEKEPGVGVYTPDGSRVAFIPLPEVPSNLEFARPPSEMMLYITAGGSLYRIRTEQHGFTASASR